MDRMIQSNRDQMDHEWRSLYSLIAKVNASFSLMSSSANTSKNISASRLDARILFSWSYKSLAALLTRVRMNSEKEEKFLIRITSCQNSFSLLVTLSSIRSSARSFEIESMILFCTDKCTLNSRT
ncbi:MAG: hypothetical protein R2787_08085 [Saprospiraceae bacterium]